MYSSIFFASDKTFATCRVLVGCPEVLLKLKRGDRQPGWWDTMLATLTYGEVILAYHAIKAL